MAAIAINPGVFDWVLKRCGLSRRDLQSKFPKIEQWATGASKPTLRQIESLAKSTSTPLGFFFLEKPPHEVLPIPHFRTSPGGKDESPSPELLDTLHSMQQRQLWMREHLIQQGQDKLQFVQSARTSDPPEQLAGRMRELLGFPMNWASGYRTWSEALGAFREAIEKAGILLSVNGIVGNNTHRKLDLEEFRGFVLVDDYAPLIFVNGVDAKAAQMFTLAHELAHVFLGKSAAFDLREMQPADNPVEIFCNQAAAEFLVPAAEMIRIRDSVKGDPDVFQKLAKRFKVSQLVIARRALDADLISRQSFLDFYRDYQKKEQHRNVKTTGGDFHQNQNLRIGRRFATYVIRCAREGKLLYSDAYKLTGLYGKTFENYASFIGFGDQ